MDRLQDHDNYLHLVVENMKEEEKAPMNLIKEDSNDGDILD